MGIMDNECRKQFESNIMNNTLLITHTDLDGVGCAYVFIDKYMRQACNKARRLRSARHDIISININTIEAIIQDLEREDSILLNQYDTLIFTDLGLSQKVYERIQNVQKLYSNSVNIWWFDHHSTSYKVWASSFDVRRSIEKNEMGFYAFIKPTSATLQYSILFEEDGEILRLPYTIPSMKICGTWVFNYFNTLPSMDYSDPFPESKSETYYSRPRFPVEIRSIDGFLEAVQLWDTGVCAERDRCGSWLATKLNTYVANTTFVDAIMNLISEDKRSLNNADKEVFDRLNQKFGVDIDHYITFPMFVDYIKSDTDVISLASFIKKHRKEIAVSERISEKVVNSVSRNGIRRILPNGRIGFICHTNSYQTLIGQKILSDPIVMICIMVGETSVSMRTIESYGLDVSKIADELGGGGHPAAAGFPVTNPFETSLKDIWDKIVNTEEFKRTIHSGEK